MYNHRFTTAARPSVGQTPGRRVRAAARASVSPAASRVFLLRRVTCRSGDAAGTSPHTRDFRPRLAAGRSEEHTSELQSLMRISYAVFCLKKKKHTTL